MSYGNLPPLFASEQRECSCCHAPLYRVDPDLRDGTDELCGWCFRPRAADAMGELFSVLSDELTPCEMPVVFPQFQHAAE